MVTPPGSALAVPDANPGLEREALDVLASVRRAMRGVLDALPFSTVRPRDLEQGLGLHKTLAWRLMRVAHGRDPLADAQHLPGAEGIDIFLTAARQKGVDRTKIDMVRKSVARFKSLVDAHAGDRASLEIMLRGITSAPEPASDLRAARRAAFRCGSYTWGMQVRTHVLTAVYTPRDDGLADVATLRAHVGMRLVRPGGQVLLSRTVESDTNRPGPRMATVEAVEPEGLMGGVPLLRDFCTRPLPDVEAVPALNNNVDYRFLDQRVGARGEITAYTAEIRRGLAGCLRRDVSNSMNALVLGVRRPTECAVIDMWAPVGLFNGHRPYGLSLCSLHSNPAREAPANWRRLPMAESAVRLGEGLECSDLAGAREYPLALERVFLRLKWDASGYEGYRLLVEYPVMATSLALVVDLPEGD